MEKETYLGRTVKEKHYFNVDGTFESYYAASSWVKANGYEAGSMDGHNPIALMKGFDYVAKWHNLNKKERQMVDGVMISDYFREKPVTILIFENEIIQPIRVSGTRKLLKNNMKYQII